MTELTTPRNLAAFADEPEREVWLAGLADVVARARDLWSLTEVREPFAPGGRSAWVAPALSPSAGEVVLKVVFPHDEARDEASGLRAWNGDGAVRLLADETADGITPVLLLERLSPGVSLSDRDELKQVEDRPRRTENPPQSLRLRDFSEGNTHRYGT